MSYILRNIEFINELKKPYRVKYEKGTINTSFKYPSKNKNYLDLKLETKMERYCIKKIR